jgi:DNA invertase Pin-like site-specific DNA recombinase
MRKALVIGYVRVSSTEQEHGYGPEVQERAIRDYCLHKKLDGLTIVHETASGESIIGRREFNQVVKQAEAAQLAGTQAYVVFHKLDRLARDLMDQEVVVGRSLKSGFRLVSTQPAEADVLDPAYAGDAARVMIRQVLGLFNQFERATIQARLDSGLAIKAKEGGSTGGRMPFGYRAEGKDIAIDPGAAAAVRRIFQMKDNELDMGSILACLGREFPDLCGHWNKTMLHRVLKRHRLYRLGLYRTRLGVEEQTRTELVIVQSMSTLGVEPGRPLPGPIVWSKIPDPVPLLTLCLLTNRTGPDIQRQISAQGLQVVWRKSRLLLPHATAKAIAEGAL